MPALQNRGFHQREGKSRGSPNPKREVPLFYPLILWQGTCQEVFLPLRGTRANIKSDFLGWASLSGGGSALVHLSATEGIGKES